MPDYTFIYDEIRLFETLKGYAGLDSCIVISDMLYNLIMNIYKIFFVNYNILAVKQNQVVVTQDEQKIQLVEDQFLLNDKPQPNTHQANQQAIPQQNGTVMPSNIPQLICVLNHVPKLLTPGQTFRLGMDQTLFNQLVSCLSKEAQLHFNINNNVMVVRSSDPCDLKVDFQVNEVIKQYQYKTIKHEVRAVNVEYIAEYLLKYGISCQQRPDYPFKSGFAAEIPQFDPEAFAAASEIIDIQADFGDTDTEDDALWD